MLTEQDLRNKIRTARDLYEIVRTMKSLAAVGMRHYEKAVESVAEYFRTVELGLQVVLRSRSPGLFEVGMKSHGGLGAVLIGSGRGLCGNFNDRIVTYAIEVMGEHLGRHGKRTVICAGEQAAVLLDAAGCPVVELLPVPDSLQGIVSRVHQLVITIEELQRSGEITSVVLFHNRLTAKSAYEPHFVKLLPLDAGWLEELRARPWETRQLPMFTMDGKRLFSSFVRHYLFVMLYKVFVESMAAENASRLNSMHAAEKNIEERLDELLFLYRRQRQNTITSELLDIVSGYKSLEGGL